MSSSQPPELLLDTHALLWWLAAPDRFSPAAHGAIADPGNRVHVSAASGWEIATKLPAASELLNDLPQLLASMLAVTPWRIAIPSIGSWPPRLSWVGSPW